jgi:hypothetical protein
MNAWGRGMRSHSGGESFVRETHALVNVLVCAMGNNTVFLERYQCLIQILNDFLDQIFIKQCEQLKKHKKLPIHCIGASKFSREVANFSNKNGE